MRRVVFVFIIIIQTDLRICLVIYGLVDSVQMMNHKTYLINICKNGSQKLLFFLLHNFTKIQEKRQDKLEESCKIR